MKLTCPYCERQFDDELVSTADLFRERGGLMARLGSGWRIANEYVDCFCQSERPVNLKKRVRILGEVAVLWEQCEFAYMGHRYRTARPQIHAAMTAVCNAQKTGFQNHNYLKKVLIKGAERLSAEGLTAEEERKREEDRAKSREHRAKSEEQGVLFEESDEPRTAEQYKAAKKIQSLADQVGRPLP